MAMRNYPHTFIQFATAALATLFCYAAMSKLLNYEQSEQEMLNQVFPQSVAIVLTWLVPSVELLVTMLLLIKTTQHIGLWVAALLLLAFSVYISVVMTGAFGRVPCSCGGILKSMSYGTHLVFNLFFMFLAIGALILVKVDLGNKWFYAKERRSGKID
ncbi:MAG: hypothetical protein EOP54_12740 [Sphingobacteriales bacterium]|nr:MAG: hypothetical protein EOP54_12740 [Sphingobacteriales bacterium]